MLTKKLFEQATAKQPQHELADIITGELFQPKARNHYEEISDVPFAPAVEMRRPSIRERVENLLNRGVDPLAHYVGTEGYDMDVPDDPEAPLTAGETNYLDAMAESLAEQAPLPDDGLPRPSPTPPEAPKADPAGVSSPPQAPPAAPVPSR